jgi:hypothetical protein
MASGQWEEQTFANGLARQPILFDGLGRCRIGLQRLEACVLAGVPFRAAVVYQSPQSDDEAAAEAEMLGAIRAHAMEIGVAYMAAMWADRAASSRG